MIGDNFQILSSQQSVFTRPIQILSSSWAIISIYARWTHAYKLPARKCMLWIKWRANLKLVINKWMTTEILIFSLIDAYLAVPVRLLSSLYGICWLVRVSRYFFESPKSITKSLLQKRPIPYNWVEHCYT